MTDGGPDQSGAEADPVGKGRPTPKRRDARKARRVRTPTTRKEAAALRRERLRAQRGEQRRALQTGDERHLPPRDAGPVKRFVRDIVDSQFTLGQIFYVIVIVSIVIAFTPHANNSPLLGIANLLLLTAFLGLMLDSVRVGRAARKAVEARFGVKETHGVWAYAVTRAMQPRRMRRPPPKVRRGGSPV